jgi:hypothetical protein
VSEEESYFNEAKSVKDKETEHEVTPPNGDDNLKEEIFSLNLKLDETSDMNSFQTKPSLDNEVVCDSFEMLSTFKRLTPDPNFLESVSVER